MLRAPVKVVPWFLARVRIGLPMISVLALASCGERPNAAFRWLEDRGVPASGSSLVRAVSSRDTELTGQLLEARVFTEHRDAGGRTPLGIAARNRDMRCAAMLLNAGADVNADSGGGASILGAAIAAGDRAMVRMLVASGARTDGRMPDGEAILPWAIRSGDRHWIDLMLHSETDPRILDRDGTPLLHLAVRAGDAGLVDALIKLGANPVARDAKGETALHLALRGDRSEIARSLVLAGADPNAHGPDGRSMLEVATERRDFERIGWLLRAGADPNHHGAMGGATAGPFALVFGSGDTALFEHFVKSGARPPGGDWQGWFERAIRGARIDETALLLSHATSCGPFTPLPFHPVEHAVRTGNPVLVKLLLDYGFDPGRSLYLAAARGDDALAGLLLAGGAPADCTFVPTPDNALTAAVRGGNDRLALRLLRHGADASPTPPEGQSLFHLAVARSCPETVRHLLEQGADPNAPFVQPVSRAFVQQVRKGVMRWILLNDRGATPLMLAADSGDIPTARYLKEAGARTNVRTRRSGLWPINFASRRSDVAMMRLFLGRDPQREERRIEIRLSEQRARMYDLAGKEIFETRVSTGRKGYETPTGTYVITNKYRHWTSTLYHASMPYFQRLSCGDFGLHQGYVPGRPASHGCIRVPAGKAAKLFAMTRTGDRVTIRP